MKLAALRSPPLFWRTFLLIVALTASSLVAWVPSVRVFEREPRAHQLAAQIVSIVHATRSALVYSDPLRRRDLLADLLENEGVRVVPLETSDSIDPVNDTPLLERVTQEVRQRLGPGTRLAARVNGITGFWVSFSIDDDAYWVYIDRDLLRRDVGNDWIAWAALATVLSLLVAIAIARLVNRPLAALSRAAADLGAGLSPAPLPDGGPVEIRTVNQSFNRMVSDLDKLNRDRAVLLAGVSHDLRTPLTRLRLELELSDLPEAGREAMIGDLEQMDSIVTQFLDYAMPVPQRRAEVLDLSALVREALARNRLLAVAAAPPDATELVEERIEDGLMVLGHRTELARTMDNLLGNALRYGRGADGRLVLSVWLQRRDGRIVLELSDRGPGIGEQDVARLVRPFERGDASRSGTAGAGLGLAIVERVARLHGAHLEFAAAQPSGLRVRLEFAPAPGAASAPQ